MKETSTKELPAKDRPAEAPFEESLARLEAIVRELETGRLSLDESLARFEEGVRLARLCRDRLAGVEERLRELLEDGSDGVVTLTPK